MIYATIMMSIKWPWR